jgi:hypothetical protein
MYWVECPRCRTPRMKHWSPEFEWFICAPCGIRGIHDKQMKTVEIKELTSWESIRS